MKQLDDLLYLFLYHRKYPCLSLWERWPSKVRTERANKLSLSFKKVAFPTLPR